MRSPLPGGWLRCSWSPATRNRPGWRNSIPADVKRVGPVVSRLVRAMAPTVSPARMTTVPAVLRPGSVSAGSCISLAVA